MLILLCVDVVTADIYSFGFWREIPRFLLKYITGYVDVSGDGNCGYRVAASFIYNNQHQWPAVRRTILNELRTFSQLYEGWNNKGTASPIHRNDWFAIGKFAPRDRWMRSIEDIFYICTGYNAVVHFIHPQVHQCFTFLPLECRIAGATRPSYRLCYFFHPDGSHYIRLDLQAEAPVPPVATLWYQMNTPSVYGWDLPWAPYVQKWEQERPPDPPASSVQQAIDPIPIPDSPSDNTIWNPFDHISFDF